MTSGLLASCWAVLALTVAWLVFRLQDLAKRFEWRCVYCDRFHDELRADARIRTSVFTRLEAKPGDTVVMEYPGTLRAESWMRVSERLRAEMKRHGHDVEVLLLDNGWKLSGVLSKAPSEEKADGSQN